jgi:hypothetical protein
MTTTIDVGAYELDVPSIVTYNDRILSFTTNLPTFSWSEPSSYSPITGYEYYFGEDRSGASGASTVATSYSLPGLVKGTYFFRVRAKNANDFYGDWNTVYIYIRPPYRFTPQ